MNQPVSQMHPDNVLSPPPGKEPLEPRNLIPNFRPLIVGIGGTLKENSSSENASRMLLRYAREMGAETQMFASTDLVLPSYDPGMTFRDPRAVKLISALRQANGIVLSSPSYHGGISGLIKNALDYTEDMKADARPYFAGRPVACISCGAGDQGANMTLTSLRMTVHALRGWPTSMGAAINTAPAVFDAQGECINEKVAILLRVMAEQLMRFTRMLHLAYTFDADWPHWARRVQISS